MPHSCRSRHRRERLNRVDCRPFDDSGERLGRAGTPSNSRVAASVLNPSALRRRLGVDRTPPIMVINPGGTPARPTVSIRTARNGHRARDIVIQWFGNEGGASCQSCRPGAGF
jgi:hypothetical protein